MLMREIEAAAVAKHGGRAYSMVRYVGGGRLTKANWQAVLDTPVVEITSPHYQGDLFHGFDDAECESGYCWT